MHLDLACKQLYFPQKRYQEDNREYCYIGKSSHFDYQLTVELVTGYLFTITFSRYSPKLTSKIQIIHQSSSLLNIFFLKKMATVRNKRKLAAVSRKTKEEHPRSGQSRNISVPRVSKRSIIHVSEAIEGRVTKKLSQELGRTESCILDAVSKVDEFLFNPQKRTLSGTIPPTSRNHDVEKQELTGIVLRVIPILNWSSLPAGPAIQLTQTETIPPTLLSSNWSICSVFLIQCSNSMRNEPML